MKEQIRKVKDKAGRVHIFKNAPRIETNHRICVVLETGEVGPILKVAGASFDGNSKYNKGYKGARFYDPESKTAYIKWIADDDLLLAVTKEDKTLIYLDGEWADGKDKEGNPEKYFKIFGSEVTNEKVA